MAAVYVGVPVVWGLSHGATGTGIGSTLLNQSADFAVEGEKTEVKNASGETVAQAHFNAKQTLTLEVIPTGANLAAAKSANTLPLPGAIVTVADTDDAELSGTNGGKYVFIKGTKKKTSTGAAVLTFELEQYVGNDIAVAMT